MHPASRSGPVMGVVAAASAAAFVWFVWRTVWIIAQASVLYPDYSHCALIPFLAGFLVWTRRVELKNRGGGSHWMGIPLVAAGLALSLLGSWYAIALQPGSLGYVFLLGVGTVLILSGGLWAFLGTNRLRTLSVPLGFLLFSIPLPESVISTLTAPLRTVAVMGATLLLRIGGLAAHREGNIIELANGSIGVDDACSGVRSVWILLAFAAFMYAVVRVSGFRAVLLLLAVPVLAIAANLVRVGLSALAVACGHAKLAEGTVHEIAGVITAGLASACIVWLGLVLSRSRGLRGSRPVAVLEGAAAPHDRRRWIAPVGVCALLILGSLARGYVEDHYRPSSRSESISVPRRTLDGLLEVIKAGRPVTMQDLTPNELGVLKPDDRLVISCADPAGVTIYLRVLYWMPELVRPADASNALLPHTPDVCFPAAGWVSDSLFEHEREFAWSNGEHVGVRIFRKLDRELLMFSWQDFGLPEARLFVPAELKARARALIRSWTVPPSVYRPARYAVVITGETGGDVKKTRKILESFSRELAPLLPAYGVGKGADDGRKTNRVD